MTVYLLQSQEKYKINYLGWMKIISKYDAIANIILLILTIKITF